MSESEVRGTGGGRRPLCGAALVTWVTRYGLVTRRWFAPADVNEGDGHWYAWVLVRVRGCACDDRGCKDDGTG